jgi:heme iron utilization protein
MNERPGPNSVHLARSLLRRCGRAALATSLGGAPYASLVLVAVDLDASPLLLLSDLARHSGNIAFEPRVSLLIDGTAGNPEPLAGPRLTVLGQAEASENPRHLARFVARHPSSERYAGFADFRMYRVRVERAHLVAGFGRIEWIEGGNLLFRGDFSELAAAETALMAQLNTDCGEAIPRCVHRLLGRGGSGWRIIGIDPEGVDLCNKEETGRLDFPAPALSPRAASAAFAKLATAARR